MAEKALEKLEDQLNCLICLDTYTDPKLLLCNHVFCRRCLVRLVDRDQQGQLTLSCPACRQVTPIPANGVAGLQPAFQVNHLIDILNEHKKAKEETLYCHVHQKGELELYCDTCQELICYQCTIKDHHGHDYNLVDELFEKHKKEIMESLNPAQGQLAAVNTALHQLDTRYREIFDQQITLEVQINKTMKQLHEVIEIRKNELIDNLHCISQEKLREMASQRVQLETIQVQLSSYLDMVMEELETSNKRELLKIKKTITKELKEVTTSFEVDTCALKSNSKADIKFSTTTKATEVCQNYGQVVAKTSPNPLACHVTGNGLAVAIVDKKSTILLQAVNFKNQPCKEPIKSLECEFVSEITGVGLKSHIERSKESQYEISYQPTIKGRHQLHIKVNRQHIRGSPFSITAKSPIEKLGTPILTIGRLKAPWGVAINQKGEVVVTEHDGHCVSVFSPSGEKLQSFGSCGYGLGQFKNPRGVAVNGDGDILVVDNNNHRIQKFTAEGNFLSSLGNRVSQTQDFDYFQSITFNASNGMVYVVNGCCIQILDSSLVCLSSFGKYGSSKGQFDYPWGVACDNTGRVYVADTANHRIQVFTAQGKFLRMFGRRGQEKGELYWPYGIAIDASDVVYVSEFYNHRISVFTSEGQFITTFGRFGEKVGEFKYPYALTVDRSGILFMCDYGNNRVQIF